MKPLENPAVQEDIKKLSPYNRDPGVIGALNLPKKITLCDATIREGEQGTIIGFTLDQKKEYIRQAADAGVELIQLSLDRKKGELQEMLNMIHEEKLPLKTEIMSMAMPFDKDAYRKTYDELLALGIDYIDIMGMMTPYAAPVMRNTPFEYIYNDAAEQIAYIKSQGGHTSYDPMDAPRMDWDVMMGAYRAAVSAGTDRIRILDSNGTSHPATWRHIVSSIRKEFPDTSICVHCHNDFGQAMANVYASLEVSVDMVDVCSNGLGERAGNASLQEVAAGAEVLYGIDTNIDLGKLRQLSIFTSDIARRPVSKNAAIVGDWAFAHGDDGHYTMNAIAPGVFQAANAVTFGNTQPVLFGKSSGPYTVLALLATLGYRDISKETATEICNELNHQILVRQSVLSDEVVRSVVSKYI